MPTNEEETEFPPYVEYLMSHYDVNVEEARLMILMAYDAHGSTFVRHDDISRYIWARDKVRENPTRSGDNTPTQ